MDIYIVETSDVHAYIAPTDYVAGSQNEELGLARVATFLDYFRKKNEHVIYIDNGDYIQGSAMAQYLAQKKESASPEPLFACLNHMGCDVMVLGNHEFNFGLSYLEKGIQSFAGEVLAANIAFDSPKLSVKPYTILERAGVRIAILGLVTNFVPSWEKPEHIEGLTFLDPIETAKEWVPKLHELADIVVVSYHGGFDRDPLSGIPIGLQTGENSALDIIDQVPGIDALLTGHQHRQFAGSYKGVPLVQPGWRASNFCMIHFEVDTSKGKPTLVDRHGYLFCTDIMQASDAMMAEISPLQKEVQEWLDRPIGRIKGDMLIKDPFQARLKGHSYVDFINRLQMKTAGVDISATTIFAGSSPGLPEEVTVRNVVNNYVFANTLAILEVSGQDLKEALERCARFFDVDDKGQPIISKEFSEPFIQYYNYDIYAGIDYVMDIRKEVGNRIVSLCYQGKAILPNDRLKVVMNNYRAVGAGGYDMYGPEKIIDDIQVDMTDTIVEYITHHPVLTPRETKNFQVVY